VISWQLLLHRN